MTLPIFVAKIETDAKPAKVHFPCKTCGLIDLVDAVTGHCRSCWRVTTLAVAAMREAAK